MSIFYKQQKEKEIKKSLITEMVENDRNFIEFTHNNIEYVVFYTKYGSAGTSIYLKSSEERLGRIDINPRNENDIRKHNIISRLDFINRFIIKEINSLDNIKLVKEQF